jgi:phytoene dehydrogenase-like protein
MVDAVVIGSGPNGLVAANMLVNSGWDVLVLEAQPEPGGTVRTGELTVPAPGFRASIQGRHLFTPPKFEANDANLNEGAINGGTSQLHQHLSSARSPVWAGRASLWTTSTSHRPVPIPGAECTERVGQTRLEELWPPNGCVFQPSCTCPGERDHWRAIRRACDDLWDRYT